MNDRSELENLPSETVFRDEIGTVFLVQRDEFDLPFVLTPGMDLEIDITSVKTPIDILYRPEV